MMKSERLRVESEEMPNWDRRIGFHFDAPPRCSHHLELQQLSQGAKVLLGLPAPEHLLHPPPGKLDGHQYKTLSLEHQLQTNFSHLILHGIQQNSAS